VPAISSSSVIVRLELDDSGGRDCCFSDVESAKTQCISAGAPRADAAAAHRPIRSETRGGLSVEDEIAGAARLRATDGHEETARHFTAITTARTPAPARAYRTAHRLTWRGCFLKERPWGFVSPDRTPHRTASNGAAARGRRHGGRRTRAGSSGCARATSGCKSASEEAARPVRSGARRTTRADRGSAILSSLVGPPRWPDRLCDRPVRGDCLGYR